MGVNRAGFKSARASLSYTVHKVINVVSESIDLVKIVPNVNIIRKEFVSR